MSRRQPADHNYTPLDLPRNQYAQYALQSVSIIHTLHATPGHTKMRTEALSLPGSLTAPDRLDHDILRIHSD